MKIIGFTGTSQGMTERQRATLAVLLRSYYPARLHHGCCIGADAQAHDVAHEIGIPCTLHPPDDDKAIAILGAVPGDIVWDAKPYLDRNMDIARACDVLIATPKTFLEQIRSGTWTTVRYAKKMNRHVTIIFPDGSTSDQSVQGPRGNVR